MRAKQKSKRVYAYELRVDANGTLWKHSINPKGRVLDGAARVEDRAQAAAMVASGEARWQATAKSRAAKGQNGADKARALHAKHPEWTLTEIARKSGCSRQAAWKALRQSPVTGRPAAPLCESCGQPMRGAALEWHKLQEDKRAETDD